MTSPKFPFRMARRPFQLAVAACLCCHPAAWRQVSIAAQTSSSPSIAAPDEATIVRGVDNAVLRRFEAVEAYADTETYKLFRGSDLEQPAAAMTVRTTYARETGKSYQVLSEEGSRVLRSAVLSPLLEDERRINLPANRQASWLISANYEMHLKPGGTQQVNGRACYGLAISPRQKAANLVEGTLWVDARDFSIVKIEGRGSKSASIFTAPSKVMRVYEPVNGFAMATHAKAVTESDLFGPTTVSIDYSDYRMQTRPQH